MTWDKQTCMNIMNGEDVLIGVCCIVFTDWCIYWKGISGWKTNQWTCWEWKESIFWNLIVVSQKTLSGFSSCLHGLMCELRAETHTFWSIPKTKNMIFNISKRSSRSKIIFIKLISMHFISKHSEKHHFSSACFGLTYKKCVQNAQQFWKIKGRTLPHLRLEHPARWICGQNGSLHTQWEMVDLFWTLKWSAVCDVKMRLSVFPTWLNLVCWHIGHPLVSV